MPVEVLTLADLVELEVRALNQEARGLALEAALTALAARVTALEAGTPPEEPPPEEPPPEEPPPEEPPGSVAVERFRYVTGDPQTYTMGWASAFRARDPASGKWLFMPVFGHSHTAANNNSIRGYDPLGNAWTQFQGNTASLAQWDKYVCQRDNYLGWSIPWRDELWIVGGAGEVNNGVFNLASRAWTHIYPRYEFGAGLIAIPPEVADPWKRQNSAIAVCEALHTALYFGGEDTLGNPQSRLVLIEPTPAGPEPFRFIELEGPMAVMRCRNNMAVAGTTAYFVGGTVKSGGASVRSLQTWRLDLVSRAWTRLADAPQMTDYPVVTWDTSVQRLVVFSGEGQRLLLVYDPATDAWADLSQAIPDIGIKNGCGAYLEGVHYYRGGAYRWNGADQDWTWSHRVYALELAAPEPTPETVPELAEPEPAPQAPSVPTATVMIQTVAWDSKAMRPPMKHTKVLYHNGFFYFMGGDFSAPEHVQSYRQEGPIRLDPARGAWEVLHPYCAVPPAIQPLGPDMCGWLYAGEVDSLLLIPGIQDTSEDNTCPGVRGHAFRFLLGIEKWELVEGQNSLFAVVTSAVTDNLPTVWTYDPETLSAYSVGYYGEILRYHVPTAQFEWVCGGSVFGVKVTPNKSAVALIDRELYLFDATAQRLLAWHIDTGEGRVVNQPPFTVHAGECHIGYLPWINRLFIHDYAGADSTSWLCHPGAGEYEKLELTDAAGRLVRARALAVDPDGKRVLMAGHTDYARWDSPLDPAWLVSIG